MPPSSAPAVPEQGNAGQAVAGQRDMRLPRCRRIAESSVFRQVFERGQKYPGTLMVLWLRREQDKATRLGVVASKRSFRRAVDRNRAKRLLREAFRRNRFRLQAGTDVILLARTRILNAGGQEVEAELMRLVARADLLQRATESTELP